MSGVQFVQQIDMNNLKITELAPGVAGTDAVNVNQLTASSPQGFAANVGDGVATTFLISHNFSTFDVLVQVYEIATGATVHPTIERAAEDDVRLTFGVAPTASQYRLLVIPVPA
jgi:hypothetical protein